MQHLHVTDVNEQGSFAVNTFDRAMKGVDRPIVQLPHVIHLRNGKPSAGVLTGKTQKLGGRTRVEVMEPARGPNGPYVRNITVDAESVYPNSRPSSEQRAFLTALAQYRYNPNDYYWAAANDALLNWTVATEERPVSRHDIHRSDTP